MKKIIIVGAYENRVNILNKLPNEYFVCGYTDLDCYYQNFTYFDNVPYLKIQSLKWVEYDYLIIAYEKEKIIVNTIAQLKNIGVEINKIIPYKIFKDNVLVDSVARYEYITCDCDGILLGMSHAQNAIQPQYISGNLFKCAAPSMDLFCQKELLKRILNIVSPEKYQKLEYCLFEVPYYIFNYDLSCFKSFVKNRLFYFYQIENYNQYGKNENEKEFIKLFENYINVFGQEKSWINYSLNKQLPETNPQNNIWGFVRKIAIAIRRNVKIIRNKDDVWKKEYPETIERNKEYFYECIKLLKQMNPNMKIIILVCPFNPVFYYLNKKSIKKQKAIFYKYITPILNDSIKVIDHFTYNDHYLFSDHCHLKIESSVRYSKMIDGIVTKYKN